MLQLEYEVEVYVSFRTLVNECKHSTLHGTTVAPVVSVTYRTLREGKVR